ncbi:SCO family protein [Cohnella endophytica]|uniref:SCO family protein n=1 Tax=Cohnella endophytica TaxID=2419778 RepID=A0A494Y056_9BACL|nr:SCO family protein [Cohnella endophytica]RKP56124.1 SCO family protein [Cohnella endophytica]
MVDEPKIEGDPTQATEPEGSTVFAEPIKQQKTWLQRYGFSLIVLGLCIVMGYYILAQQNGKKSDNLPVQKAGTEFSYSDTDGNNVTLSNTNGKVRLLYFFFATCPDVCPPTTALMSMVQDQLKEDGVFGNKVEFLSVTIDPDHDSVESLKKYADTFDADPAGWKFLRGDDQQAIADLADKYDILVGKDKDGNFFHMNLIVLLDKDGNVRDWISANDYIEQGENNLTPQDMAKKIKSLL